MKKIIIIGIYLISVIGGNAWGQAKKPTIMVLPSDLWCNKNGYVTTINNLGTEQIIPDYKKALQNDPDLLLVIAKINTLMMERGFPLKNLESALKTIEQEQAENNIAQSKTSGASISESPMDRLKKTAKADIIMQITWMINTEGPKKSITFNLQGLDAYTDKQIAGAQGTGEPSFSAEIPKLLEAAVLTHIENFNAQLQKHFDDLFENGREIIVRLKKWDTSPVDFEKEFDGKELGDIIDTWVAKNTLKGRYSMTDKTENMLVFEQVRIPLYEESGKAMDANGFGNQLKKFLKAEPYNLPCKVMVKGLGQVTLIIGEK